MTIDFKTTLLCQFNAIKLRKISPLPKGVAIQSLCDNDIDSF